MKIKHLLYVLMLALTGFSLTACGDDDEPDNDTAGQLKGNYTGILEASVMGTHCDFDGTYTVAIDDVKAGNNAKTASVTLPECSFTIPGTDSHQTIPSVKIDNVSVFMSNGSYKLASGNVTVEQNGVQYSVMLEGTVKDNTASLNYSMQPGRMPMVINFTFNGSSK